MLKLRRGVLCLALLGAAAAAQAFPTSDRPIRLIVPFPPGGTVDIVARTLAQRLGEQLKHAVIVENRAGANGIIGSDLVAKGRRPTGTRDWCKR